MKLNISKGANVNYLAKIVHIDRFAPHPNPKYTKLQVAHVDGFNLIVSTDMTEGNYVYFPAMSQINPELLSYMSLYRNTEKNRDTEQSGFFEDNGRVKAIRLGGALSEGFLMPIKDLQDWILYSVNVELTDVEIGTEFNEIEHNGKVFWVNRKYIVQVNRSMRNASGQHRNNKLKRFNRLIDGQFKFHYDTVLLRKEPWAINPLDIISITSKWHGTSLIAARVLCKHPRKKWDKILTWLYKKLGGTLPRYADVDSYPEYDYIWSSRSVIKNSNINPSTGEGFYEVDVWKHGFEYLKPYLQKGMTIYAEIVGYLPNGAYIQKGYDYGCVPPENDEYVPEKNFKVRVYRITQTNVDGLINEYSAKEVQDYCKSVGLIPVIQFYYGIAADLYPGIHINNDWNEKFINSLADDKNFFMEKSSPDCLYNKVPHEGIVIKKEDGMSHAWKLKTFAFMNREQKELDAGESNVEDNN